MSIVIGGFVTSAVNPSKCSKPLCCVTQYTEWCPSCCKLEDWNSCSYTPTHVYMCYLLLQVTTTSQSGNNILTNHNLDWWLALNYVICWSIVVVTGEVTRFQVPMLSTANGFACSIRFEVFSIKYWLHKALCYKVVIILESCVFKF